ncbi:MAG: hypothetical protein FP825_06590 [Hyphomonas sp.]|uniref:DNA primase family protein n=1 Tax=Hyphomonas sp. TaxID=87 RepID=UPI001803438D|nr:phage/plasmid primase, P4 family [Hyphomonas sp.]MBA3068127.1 hypothetical protein [Hyphomonas sp.]MBU3922026.1 hypothetical protein [Alphaproteobacteria bacterium]MBU4061138.1 hypothetical protein [Alphaproteobacteria bacterium]MBU4162862.1 hypothetical protein [Alphaproteobacteria bacterium]
MTAFEDVDGYLARRGGRLVRWNGDFYSYEGGVYRAVDMEAMRADVYLRSSANTKSKVDRFIDALKSRVFVDRLSFAPPSLLEPVALDPANLIVLRNGILDLTTSQLYAHDARVFSVTALPFDFDASATAPRWLEFLHGIWPDEADCRETLQLIFGYLISPRTDLQVIPVIVGPPRSGKGTIGRALVELIGAGNWAAPTLDSFGESFGLQPLIGKRLALISDARLDKRSPKSRITETLLRISGEDHVSVQRKFMEDWQGRLGCVIVIMGNEPPTFHDSSSALIARYRVLNMRKSFVGRENRGLDQAVRAELPGILNWAIEGWRKLSVAGEIAQPASSNDLVMSMDRLSNVVRAFVQDACTLEADATVPKDLLFQHFNSWCDSEGVRRSLSREWFGREIISAYGHSGVAAVRRDGARAYSGIRFKRAGE